MGKKEKPTLGEKICTWLSILAGLLTFGTLIPKIPWRRTAVWSGFHTRFAVARDYHPYGATDKNGMTVTWFTLKTRVCSKSREFNAGSITGSIVGLTGNGGALLGCSYWQICKDAAANRCKEYEICAIIGGISMLFQFIAGVLALMIPVQFAQEKAKENRKKKKKMKGAKQTTMIIALCAYGTSLVGYFAWSGYLSSMISSFQTAGAYPDAAAHYGSYIGIAANVFIMISSVIATFRYMTFSTEKDKPEEDEGRDDLPPPPPGALGGVGGPPPPPGALPPPGAAPPGTAPPEAAPPGDAPLPPGVPPPPALAGDGGGPPGE